MDRWKGAMREAYAKAMKNCSKSAAIEEKYYDCKVRFTQLKPGDQALVPLISKIGLDRATYIQKMKPEIARGGHIGVTTCQVAPIDRHMLNGKHRRNLALTFSVYRSRTYYT